MKSDDFFEEGDALVIVDVQRDFCPGGALAVAGGDRIVPVINTWLQKARQSGVPVYASRDWHPVGHLSFVSQGGQWPPHCIQDTPGAAFHDDLRLPADAVVVTKGVRFDHDQNSVFDATGLADDLRRKGIRRLLLTGLALDVCVLATALDGRREGFEVVLIVDATRPVSADAGTAALARMRAAGVAVLDGGQGRGADSSVEADICLKAPEWAEHQRFSDDDLDCDDGRAG